LGRRMGEPTGLVRGCRGTGGLLVLVPGLTPP
jgi:hypothetical protein